MDELERIAVGAGLSWSDLENILYILDYGKVDIIPRPDEDADQNKLNMYAELVLRKMAGLLRE